MLLFGVTFNGRDKRVSFQYGTLNEVNYLMLKDSVKAAFGMTEASEKFELYLYNDDFKSYYEIEPTDFPITINAKLQVRLVNETVEDLSDSGISSLKSPQVEPNDNNTENGVITIHVNNSMRNELWEPGKVSLTIDDFSRGGSREELENAMISYQSQLDKTQTHQAHLASYSLKKDIVNILAKRLFRYTCYPTAAMLSDACVHLVKSFPCLATIHETRDRLGIQAWKSRLSDKLNELRRASKHPEVLANKKKNSTGHVLLRPTMGEVNMLPERFTFPEPLEEEELKIEIKLALLKENINFDFVREKMVLLFPQRRDFIVKQPSLVQIKEEWPALLYPNILMMEAATLLLNHPLESLRTRLTKYETNIKVKTVCPRYSVGSHLNAAKLEQIRGIDSEDNLLLSVHNIFFHEKCIVQTADSLSALKDAEESNADVRATLAAPLLLREDDGTLTILCESQVVCKNILDLKEAVAVLMSCYYAFHMKFPPKVYEKTLYFLAFLCGADNIQHKYRVVSRLIEFVKLNQLNL